MCEPAVELKGKECDHDSEYFSHDVSPKDGNCDKCDAGVYAFDGVFGGDVSICDGGDHCYAVVHDVGIHLVPVEHYGHLIKSPTVIHPAEVGSVWTVVVVLVYPKADYIEENPHVMAVDIAEDYELYNQVASIQPDVQLRHTLKLYVDATSCVYLSQPHKFHQVQREKTSCQRNHHR